MEAEELKRRVCEAIGRRASEIVALGEELFHSAELGYKEYRSAKALAERLKSLGLEVREGLAVTGLRATLNQGVEGPTVAIIGELDALPCPEHRGAHPETGAAHVCGHHAQIVQLFGAGVGLLASGVLEALAGKVVLFAVPAEECVELEWRLRAIEEGRFGFLGGKQELVRLGELDDIDMVIGTHLWAHKAEELPLRKAKAGGTGNGFIAKRVRFLGREAHGARPELGINALHAAHVALAGINAQAVTFRDEDTVRVHPIITHGGNVVNIIPAEVVLETYVRAKSLEALREANEKVDRALKAGAMALGAAVEIRDYPGYFPSLRHEGLARAFLRNMAQLIGEENAALDEEHGAGSSDIGDLSQLMPAIQASVSGARGVGHSPDYEIADPEMAYVLSSQALAMTAVDLLYDGAREARGILAAFKPALTKEEYLRALSDFARTNIYRF